MRLPVALVFGALWAAYRLGYGDGVRDTVNGIASGYRRAMTAAGR